MIQIEIFEDDKYLNKTAKELCNDWLQEYCPIIDVIDIKYQKIENIHSILVIYKKVGDLSR